jgi:hypothetical protein
MENIHRWNGYWGWLTLRTNMIGNSMVAKVTGLIGSKDLKFHLIKACWKGCLSFKEAWFTSKIQIEFL